MRNHPLRGISWLCLCAAVLAPLTASGHAERRSFFPQDRHERPEYRPLLPTPQAERLVVCKKPGDEGVGPGEDSLTRIETMGDAALRAVNLRLHEECAFEHLQAAVDAVIQRGTTIYVLPGLYREQPSIRALDERGGATTVADTAFCQAVLAAGTGALSYEQQYRCRHIQNTVAIFGDPDFTDDNCGADIEGVCANPATQKCNTATSNCRYYDLQIEGTGEEITDVIFEGDFADDGQFRYLNGIRADRADGIYLRNFTTQIYEFNAVYILETDGAVMESLLARWVDEYSFLTFASDRVLYDRCGGYGAADSVLYPGSGADIYKNAQHSDANLRARQGTEIRDSYGHHAAGGYSGTSGNSPWVHDSLFYKNQTGLATESIFGGHPGMPQDHGLFENNKIWNNNKNYFAFVENDGPCIAQTPRDRGVVPPEFREFDTLPPEAQEAILDRMVLCPGIPFPTGAGMVIGGGNYDVNQHNQVWDNWRYGYMLFHVPTALRYTEDEPNEYAAANPYDNSHFDRFLDNRFAENTVTVPSRLQPNLVDFWYDNSGFGNCFDGNTSFDAGGVTADTGNPALSLPGGPCVDGPLPDPATQTATAQNDRIAFLASCIAYSRDDPATKSPECPFFDPLVAPPGRVGETTVIVSQPPVASVPLGGTAKAGYFVLNNDTGNLQSVSSVTLAAAGPVQYLDGLTLSVTVAHDGQVRTFSAALDSLAGENVFTFAEPVPIPPVNYVMFDLSATAGGTVAVKSGSAVMLASGAGSLGLGAVLLLAAPGRRRRVALIGLLALAAAATLSSCGESTPIGGGAIRFTLSGLDVTDDNGPVSYAGLPKAVGSLELR